MREDRSCYALTSKVESDPKHPSAVQFFCVAIFLFDHLAARSMRDVGNVKLSGLAVRHA
jgi:hypothetical protein